MTKLLSLQNVSVGYNQKVVLKDVNLDVYEHDFIGIIGPNGGGKTTLVKAILGLVPLISGTIEYNLKSKNIGYLPQHFNFDKQFPIRVIDVVLSGLFDSSSIIIKFSKQQKKQAKEILEKMGILDLSNSLISEISGGQMQRVLLSRAMISNPEILILDEPTSYIDSNFEKELHETLKHLNETMTILMVSHDMGTISYYVKSIACVNKTLHYHKSNVITQEQLQQYNCPIQLITHGDVPHTVLHNH
ncbi:MAG: metal ABC transporter ATP-binding protein [Bacteroidales bacterium]|jgi:zinc transport system ATP-binding protein